MHDIEPFWKWKEIYDASSDHDSPFYGRQYSELEFSNKIYNYYIHPQWDEFGSKTLYLKILMADYDGAYAILELMGEWNDAIENDIMQLKREVIEQLQMNGIRYFILLGENVFNFHASDDCYYEEWWQEVSENGGWIAALQFRDHVWDEMGRAGLNLYLTGSPELDEVPWRKMKPEAVFKAVQLLVQRILR
jgi:hypothetical protein